MSYPNGYFEHLTIDGDRWDLLAYQFYGDASKQGVLLDANRSLFIDPITVPPLILKSGITLIVPVLDADEIDDSVLPPWKRSEATYE